MLHTFGHRHSWAARVVAFALVACALQLAGPQAFGAVSGSAPRRGPGVHTLAIRYELDEMLLNRAWARDVRIAVHARRAKHAIAAAKSQLGVPYVYASARPGHGFDCSGLVMWAWGRAGVHLPHNSTEQYLALHHVSKADLLPGDVLYFLEPQDHVAIYLGGNRMIHAPHSGESVMIQRIYWRYFVGGARPAP
jgi:cell wall-associated NlpC family hydrolase